jgi:hypothetical protein
MVITYIPAALPRIMNLEQLVDSKFNHMVKNFTPINKRPCVIRIIGRFFNYSLINIHAPTNDSEEEGKDQFYEQLERAFAACPSHDVKLVMGDANAKVGRETVHQPMIGKHSLHESTHENGLRLWSILPQSGKWRSKVRTLCTNESTSKQADRQIDHCLIDGRHFSDVIDSAEGWKHRFRPHASRYKIESKNMPYQQHKAD